MTAATTAPTTFWSTAARPRYAMIVGHGRSGTNWLLDLLEFSPLTHCRNEPNELEDAPPWSLLPEPWIADTDAAAMADHWPRVVEHAATHVGCRDHLLQRPKDHLQPLAWRLGLDRVMKGARLRPITALFIPRLRRPHWRVPAWHSDPRKLSRAMLVLKVNSVPGWVRWVLAHEPDAAVIHILRHPGGYLNSWANRWLRPNDAAEVHRLNLDRLGRIEWADPAWGRRWGRIDAMDVQESELWFWRYANEAIFAGGQGRPGYRTILYEQLVDRPLDMARSLYELCRLPWGPGIEEAVLQTTGESEQIASAWRSRLKPEQVAMVERILEGSPLAALWSGAA